MPTLSAHVNDVWDQGGTSGDPAISPEGIDAGGFAGYGFERDGLVLGIEGDVSFPDFSEDEPCGASFDCTLDVQVLSSLRGRAGLAFGRLQVYGTAGLALGIIQTETGLPGSGSDSEMLARLRREFALDGERACE